MIAWLTFALGCAIVAALSLIHPDDARWFALAFAGVLFVATAIPRRVQAGPKTGESQDWGEVSDSR